MPSVESPCFLLPHGCERSAVYMCIPVDQNVAKMSSVLETLTEYDGIVDMPCGVSCDDFEAWSEMVTQDHCDLTVDELVSAIQVRCKALSIGSKTIITCVLQSMFIATECIR